MKSIPILFLFTAFLAHGSVAHAEEAHEPALDVTTPLRVDPAAHVEFDIAADGTVWARGRTYKASFGVDGATYIPFLGSRAPRNFPVRLAPGRVTIAGVDVAFDAHASAVLDGDVVSYDRGTFVERYLLSPDGVEQTFVFHALAQRGEILVEVDLDTQLTRGDFVDGFRFSTELGGVHYGRAFAVDGCGNKRGIESRLCDRAITLRVPSEFAERAELPLVIDPILSTFVVGNLDTNERAADTAYDVTDAHWFTVYEDVFSLTDTDVRGVRHTSAGSIDSVRYIDLTNDSWASPRVANDNGTNKFLVVAAVGDAPARRIFGRIVDATAALAISASIPISPAIPVLDHLDPDVGGDVTGQPGSKFAVVWQRESVAGPEIIAKLITASNGLVGGSTYVISGGDHAETNPAISKTNGPDTGVEQSWHIVWEHTVGAFDHDIHARGLHPDGTLSGGPSLISGLDTDDRNPSCSPILGDGLGYYVWIATYESKVSGGDSDVVVRGVLGLIAFTTLSVESSLPNPERDQLTPVCETDGRQFVVAFSERTTPTYFATDIKLLSVAYTDGYLVASESNQTVAAGNVMNRRPAISSRRSGGSGSDQLVVLYDRVATGDLDVFMTTYSPPLGGPMRSVCFGDGTGAVCPCLNFGSAGHGCGNSMNPSGALLTATGTAVFGALDSVQFVASGLPSSSPCLFYQGLPPVGASPQGTTFGDGLRCITSNIVRLATKTAVSGVASFPEPGDAKVSVQGLILPNGATRGYQVFYRNNASFCTPAGFNITNAVIVTWLP